MPHYADGTLAEIGDPVIGTGYNIPGEIIGILVDITPGTDTCNVKVLTHKTKDIPKEVMFNQDWETYQLKVPVITNPDGSGKAYIPVIEYGQADKFWRLTPFFSKLGVGINAQEIAV